MMKDSDTDPNALPSLDPFVDTSPLKNPSNKHSDLTPLKKQNKTLKFSEEEDVHSISSPATPPSRIRGNVLSPHMLVYPISPFASPFSEDTAPEVIWDYTQKNSPDVPDEGKPTIKDLLNNMNYSVPKPSSKSVYDDFLQNWVFVPRSDTLNPPEKQTRTRRKSRKNSPRCFDEMMKLMETFSNADCFSSAKQDLTKTSGKEISEAAENTVNNTEAFCKPIFQDCDEKNIDASIDKLWDSSVEELWGDDSEDEMFVKATQLAEENEKSSVDASESSENTCAKIENKPVENLQSLGKQSCEDISKKSSEFKMNEVNELSLDSQCYSGSKLNTFKCDFQKNENNSALGFRHKSLSTKSVTYAESFCDKKKTCNAPFINLSSKNLMKSSMETDGYVNKTNFVNPTKPANIDFAKSYKGINKNVKETPNLEFDIFHYNADILSEPTVLPLPQKIESQSLVQQKCSAEEIARKKEDALKRRKQKQLLRQSSFSKGKK